MTEKIKLTFLGTGSAVPTAKRNHPAMLLQYKDENILVDCGEGTQRQFRLADLNPCKITKILITHWHADHVLGLGGLFQTLMLNGYNRELIIYGPKGTKEMLKYYYDLFIGKGNPLNMKVFEVTGKFFENEDFILEAENADHDTPANFYSFTIKEKNRLNKKKLEKLKLPNSPLIAELRQGKTIEFNGKKIEGKKLLYKEEQRKITFIMDTKLTANAAKIAKDSDILVSEATYLEDSDNGKELATEHFHLTAKQAADIANKSNSKKLILTHLSQRYENPTPILKEAKKFFKNSIVAEDLMSFEI